MPEADLTLINPENVYFTFSRIRPQFSCGRFIEDTLRDVVEHRIRVEDLPLIAVLFDGKNYFSMNNRRLFLFKELAKMGFLTQIPVRLRPVPQTKRMKEKYTPEKCALVARLKGAAGNQDESASEPEPESSGEDESAEKRVVQSKTAAKAAKRAARAQAIESSGMREKNDDDLASKLADFSIGEGSDDDGIPTNNIKSGKRKGKR